MRSDDVLDVFRSGPRTALGAALLLGGKRQHASHHVSWLVAHGYLARTGRKFPAPDGARRHHVEYQITELGAAKVRDECPRRRGSPRPAPAAPDPATVVPAALAARTPLELAWVQPWA